MRSALLPLAVLLAAPVVRADDAADAKAIVEKAIKARDGKAGPITAMTWTEKPKYADYDPTVIDTHRMSFQAPDKMRAVVTITSNNPTLETIIVMSGERVWFDHGARTEELTGDERSRWLTATSVMWVTTLSPLLGDNGFTLATTKGEDVGGRPAVGVKVSNGKRTVAALYFDGQTGLLVKCKTAVKVDRKEVVEELTFSEYKDFGGRQFPTKSAVAHDGKEWIWSTLSDHKVVERLDPKLFEKPAEKP